MHLDFVSGVSKSYHITPKGRLVTKENKRGTGLENQAGKRTTRVGRETSIKGKTKRPTQSKENPETNQDHNAQVAINTNSNCDDQDHNAYCEDCNE